MCFDLQLTDLPEDCFFILLASPLPRHKKNTKKKMNNTLLLQHLSFCHSTLYLLVDLGKLFEMKCHWYLRHLVKKYQ